MLAGQCKLQSYQAAVYSPRSLLGGTFVANVAAGLGCGRFNVWAAELCAALQFVCCQPRPKLDGAHDAGQAD